MTTERKKTISKHYYDDEIKAIGPDGEIILKEDTRRVFDFDIEEKVEDMRLNFKLKMNKLRDRVQNIRDEEKNFD